MNEYLLKLYDWIGTKDSTFNSRISSEDFVSKMENDSDYGSKMYDWISTKDKSFEARLDRKEFYNKTFKKKSPFRDIFEESQDASSSTEVQEGMESNIQEEKDNGSSGYSEATKALEDRYNPNIEVPKKGEKPTIENAPDWMKDPNLFAAREAGTVTDKDYREAGLEQGPVSTVGGSPTRQEQVEAFSRIENQKVKTDEELDFIAKQKGLGTPFAYEEFSTGDTFVKDNFDSEFLSKMNLNLTDFSGYIEKEGLKKDYLDREKRGFYENKDRFVKNDVVLAKETDKLLMLNNYIKLQQKRDIDWQKLQDQRKTGVDPNNTEFKDSYKPSASNVNSKMLGNYIQKEMPQLTKKLKERDAKTKELYDQYKSGGISWTTFIATTSKSGWNGLAGRIEELNASAWGAMSLTGLDYYQNQADIRRSKISQDELLADDNLSYTFATGQQVKVNGVNYLVNKNNQIYDVDKKINVTNVIDEKNYNNILKKSVTEGVTNSTFSGRGMTYETANVVGDMVIQIAGTKGFGSALTKASALSGTVSKGTGLLSKGKNLLGKSIGYANKIPVDRSMASAIMAQSTMGLSSGYEETLKAAKEAGINDEEARKLALIAGKETAALYALTAPISTQTKATEAIFGKIKKNTLDDVVSIYLKNGEAAVFRKFKESGKKVLDYLGEGAKEGVQENIQQSGETLIIGDRTNKRAGQDIVKSDISYDDFINTTILSFTAGMLMPGAGSAMKSLNKKKRSLLGFDGIDRLKSLEELANNEDKVRSMLTSQEGKGVYTPKEVSDLLGEIKLFKTTIGKVPGSVNAKATMEVIEDIDNISKLQTKKKSLDPAFHEDIDKEILESRENIKTTIEAYKNLDTAIESALKTQEVATEEVATEEVATEEAAKEEVATEEVAKEEVATEEVAKEERLKDSQIPKSRTDFTVKDMDGKTTKVEVITNLDGSRKFIYKNENGWYRTETISKDNTLSNEAYVDLILEGDISDSSNVSLDKVIGPKMEEKLSDRQREAIGLKPRIKEDVNDEVEELSIPKAIVNRGVDMVNKVKSGIKLKVSPKSILKSLKPKIAFTPQEIQEISKYLDQEVSRPSKKKLAEKSKIDEEVKALSELFDKEATDLETKVENSKKALSKLNPDVKFVLHESEQEYDKVAKKGTAGEFNPSTNTIHINPAKANGRTVAHEAFHALIVNSLKTDEKTRAVTERMLKAISKSVSTELQLELDAFLVNYDESIQSEEALSEIIGKLADEYSTLDAKAQNLISRWLQKLAKMLGLAKFTDADVVDMLNVISGKIASGEVISGDDVNILEDIQGESGLVGEVGDISSNRNSIPAPSIKTDTRSFAKLVKDRDLVDFRGMNFITNMYDYTTAGVVNFANNLKLNLFGGKNYVPYMMDKKGLSLGDMSNLAAFNTEAQAESFIRNVRKGNARLFIPHSGSLSGSWQFQHAIFEQMMDIVIDNEVLTNKEIIKMFNQAVDNTNLYNQFKDRTKEFNKKGYWVKVTEPKKKNNLKETKREKIYEAPETQQVIREDLVKFNKNTGQELLNLDKYLSDPKELVKLLDAETNSSPDLRKRLSDKLTANKKIQKKLGIERKADFWDKIMDPMNKGVKGGELMGIVEFDNTNFKVVKTKLGDVDHHPSFGWTVLAKIEGIYQPTNFHKTWDVTDEYVKYNKEETVVSRKSDVSMKSYKDSNVSSSAGSIPKQGTVTNVPSKRSQKSSKPTVQELINEAKKKGFSDEGITAYLKSIGHVPTADEIQTLGKEALKDKTKKKTWKGTKRRLREKIFDRQTRVKDTLKGLDSKQGEKAKTMLVNKAGASGYANKRFKEAEESIFKKKVAGVSVDLSADETRQLNNIIYSERIISINKSREAKGEEKYIGRLGFDSVAAQESLDKIKSEVGDKKFKDLTNRANIYFTTLKKSLERGYKAGLISEEVYNELKDVNYSPIRTIKYLLPDSDLYGAEVDNLLMQTGTSYEFISKLSDSNNSDIVTDAKWLLMSNISMTEARVSSNRVLSAFDKAIKGATLEQKAEFSEYIRENPVVGTKSNGELKFKYDKKMPVGFTSLSYKENGQLRKIIVEKKYAEILLDQKKSSKILSGVGTLSGGGVLRFFATAGNPLFIVGNTAIDFTNVLFLSNVYSEFKLLGGAELGLDFFKNFAKKVSNTKNYNEIYDEFVEHGGSMDYLSTDGVSKLARTKYKNNRVSEIGAKALVGIGRFMGYLGESSEISMRLAVYEKSKSNQLKQFKKENNREPDELELEEIKFRAARESRETIDFNQGGDVVKKLDKVMPYLNAATQGTRKFIDYASTNPKGFASSIIQAGIYSAGLMALSMMNLFRGLDDEEDKKRILEAINSLSPYERANYHVIFTGSRDEDGEFEYYRIKKLPLLSVATTAAEEIVINSMLKQKGLDRDFDFSLTGKTMEGGLPFVPTLPNLINRNPLVSSSMSYINNKDYFYDTDIFKGPIGEISPESEGLYDKKVANIYKDISAYLGTSPIRLQASFEKIITSPNTNPIVGLAYSGYDTILGSYKGEGPDEDSSKGLDKLMETVGRKVKRKTNKNTLIYRDKETQKEEIIKIKSKTYNQEQKVYSIIKDKLESGETYNKEEYVKIIKENFEPIDRKKYYKKYLIYMRNRNVDKTILDIVFEQNAEAQAYMIQQKFGNSFDEEEEKEIRLVFSAARRKFSKKALYIYRKNISKK